MFPRYHHVQSALTQQNSELQDTRMLTEFLERVELEESQEFGSSQFRLGQVKTFKTLCVCVCLPTWPDCLVLRVFLCETVNLKKCSNVMIKRSHVTVILTSIVIAVWATGSVGMWISVKCDSCGWQSWKSLSFTSETLYRNCRSRHLWHALLIIFWLIAQP